MSIREVLLWAILLSGCPRDETAAPPDLSDLSAATGCASTCDCAPGLGCLFSRCRVLVMKAYCCQAAECPKGNICEWPENFFSFCGAPISGGGANCANLFFEPGSCSDANREVCRKHGCEDCFLGSVMGKPVPQCR